MGFGRALQRSDSELEPDDEVGRWMGHKHLGEWSSTSKETLWWFQPWCGQIVGREVARMLDELIWKESRA